MDCSCTVYSWFCVLHWAFYLSGNKRNRLMTEFVPKRKKLLTKPLLKYSVGVAVCVLIETAMHIGKDMKPVRVQGKAYEPFSVEEIENPADDKKEEAPSHVANIGGKKR